MAQALFDDHPIEHYLRESGEVPELMPGGTDEFSREPSHHHHHTPHLWRWLPRLVRPLLNMARRVLESTGLRSHSPASEFAERFKYVVISSPLLSSSLSSSPPRAATPTTPGHFEHRCQPPNVITPMTSSTSPLSSVFTFTLACLVPAALVQGYYISGILILAAVNVSSNHSILFQSSHNADPGACFWSMTLESLDALVIANNTWEAVVSEALSILESEDRNLVHPSSSPSSPSSSLRISLSSSLHTTQTQCDNVRQLLAALTSPLVLSQLSEMYGPPSPSPLHSSFSQPANFAPTRPMSLAIPQPALRRSSSYYASYDHAQPPTSGAYTRARTCSAPHSFSDKRSTWNGSYMSLAGLAPRRQKRRSDISTLVSPEHLKVPAIPANAKGSASVPPTPSQPLVDAPAIAEDADAEDEPFGIAALDLHRRRRNTRVLLTDRTRPSSMSTSAHGSPLSSTFGSRFTTLSSAASSSRHVHAHPLSLSNLHLALHGALASKRFVCAHLLALRFSDPAAESNHRPCDPDEDLDGEDESYWEDVRSVVSLLTTTLEDASARLTEALADKARRMRREEQLSEEESCPESSLPVQARRRSALLAPQSFAPVPSHLSRFAAHVDAISSALDDARAHLQSCVASLQDLSVTDADDADDAATAVGNDAEAEAPLQSYERLRRELGVALKECERGRGTLLELVRGDPMDRPDEDGPPRHEEHFSSGESDKTLFNADDPVELKDTQVEAQEHEHDAPVFDDASSHLILTASSQHLPPPGIEQVFESVSAAQPFVRERSKLTREERIRMAKERRESGASSFAVLGPRVNHSEPPEQWGPGGEVVQELKDVIWKVGEQRRKMVARSSSPGRHPDDRHSPTS